MRKRGATPREWPPRCCGSSPLSLFEKGRAGCPSVAGRFPPLQEGRPRNYALQDFIARCRSVVVRPIGVLPVTVSCCSSMFQEPETGLLRMGGGTLSFLLPPDPHPTVCKKRDAPRLNAMTRHCLIGPQPSALPPWRLRASFFLLVLSTYRLACLSLYY